ncbi:hypothetical protein F3Y22_tig00109916pilonHSYRG00008 [Hibiscus syriacus]|uniref:Reverse transcriptase Ty1/copia-type domain-containing protein n=1 Tax=Hibiscus syriacus TaxID=106335 RepID=A0A6A3BYM7_HIBSY|nr:hypothetical protein F3Y22_tig00109916pilonHSYRG00008 [Hibiscus syriacus]
MLQQPPPSSSLILDSPTSRGPIPGPNSSLTSMSAPNSSPRPNNHMLHRMTTRAINGIFKTNPKYSTNYHATTTKARLVGDGKTQEQGVDCDETFSPVVKPTTIRAVLNIVVSKSWPIHQIDVNNAFLHATIGFSHKSDHSLFIYKNGSDTAYILLYMDDIILIASSDRLRKYFMTLLGSEFSMKNLGPLSFFLSIDVTRHAHGLFLSQKQYAAKIIERAGTLQYLTFTRPDISYVVQHICLHIHAPTNEHMTALKRIIHYLHGTLSHGLHLYKSTVDRLISYTDADWGGCPNTYRSTSGNLILELHCPIQKATLVYYDIVSVIYLSGNHVQHQCIKHIEMDIHFVREKVARGEGQSKHMRASRFD